MKLKSYILVGYIISTLLTIIVVFWAIQRMLIEEREIYFLVGMTLVASFIGAGISLFLLSPVFTSLGKLKEHAKRVADKDFPSNLEVQGPVEFQQLGQAFNEMSHDLQATFDSLEESEREKGLMIAQLSHDIKTPITSIQATVEGILDGVIKEGEQDHYLATIGRQTERLNKLVEELNFLTLNTARNQVETTSKDSIFLDQLLIECMSEFQFLIELSCPALRNSSAGEVNSESSNSSVIKTAIFLLMLPPRCCRSDYCAVRQRRSPENHRRQA